MTPEEEGVMSQVEERLVGVESDTPTSSPIKPYRFRMTEVEGFRYRVKVSEFLSSIYLGMVS